MKTHAQKPSQAPNPTAPHLAGKRPNPQTAGRVVHPNMPLQRAIGDQESERSLPGNAEAVAIDSDPSEVLGFAHDFSQTPVFSKTRVRIQTKLTVNEPGDIFEQEADRVAEQVMRMPDSAMALPNHGPVQRVPAAATETGQTQASALVGDVLRSPGQPLDSSTRAFMEPRFGHDFSHVRIHADEKATHSARSLNALAYTAGNHLVFRADTYQLGSVCRRRLIAHELAHVVQQRPYSSPGFASKFSINSRLASDKIGPPTVNGKALLIQRQVDENEAVHQKSDAKPEKAAKAINKEVDLFTTTGNVRDAMFGGLGLGTDEDKVFANLAKLKKDPQLVGGFRLVYKQRFGVDVVEDINAEFSDNLGGFERTKALDYLLIQTSASELLTAGKKVGMAAFKGLLLNPIWKGIVHPFYKLAEAYVAGFRGYVAFSDKGLVSDIHKPEVARIHSFVALPSHAETRFVLSKEDNDLVIKDAKVFPETEKAKRQIARIFSGAKVKDVLLGETYDNYTPMKYMARGRNLADTVANPPSKYPASFAQDTAGKNITRGILGSFDLRYNIFRLDKNKQSAQVSFTIIDKINWESIFHQRPKGGEYKSLYKGDPGEQIQLTISFVQTVPDESES